MALTLDDLPPELVALIVTALVDIDGWSSPVSLAVTSSHYQDIVEDIIWRDLFIRTGRNLRNIWAALRSRPERATVVRKIDLRAKPRHEVGLQKLRKVLNMTQNLQELTIESPTCNYQRWRGDVNWPPIYKDIEYVFQLTALKIPASLITNGPTLQALKRLVLHNNGDNSRFWNAYHDIFHLPCVEELTLSCENREHVDERGRNSGNLFIEYTEQTHKALVQQAHSLQSLTYRPQSAVLADKLSFLGHLEDAAARLTSHLSQLFTRFSIDAKLGYGLRLESAALQAAPQLEELTVVHMEDHERLSGRNLLPNASPDPNDKPSTMRRLKYSRAASRPRQKPGVYREISQSSYNNCCGKKREAPLHEKYQAEGLLSVIRGNLIPPLLHEETEEDADLLFDSGAGDWQSLPDAVLYSNAHWPIDDGSDSDGDVVILDDETLNGEDLASEDNDTDANSDITDDAGHSISINDDLSSTD